MMRLVLCALLFGACALGDDDGPAADPADGRKTVDSREGPMADASSGLPDSPRYPDSRPPPDAPPVYDAAPCGTPGPDTCAAAIDLTAMAGTAAGATATGDTTLLDDTITSAECTGFPNPGNDAIYKVTANSGQMIIATLTPTGDWDPSVYISNACPTTECLACFYIGVSGYPETATYPVTANGTYYVVVDGYAMYAFGCYSLNVKLM